jgi:hypothetical protein
MVGWLVDLFVCWLVGVGGVPKLQEGVSIFLDQIPKNIEEKEKNGPKK